MTQEKSKSVEETLIKISLRQLWFLVVFLVGSSAFAVLLYADIMSSQKDILAEVKKNATERNYIFESVNKELGNHELRIVKLEDR